MNEENRNLEEMMKAATEKVGETIKTPSDSKKSNKIILFSVIGLIVVGGLIFAGKALLFNNEDFVDQTDNPGWVGGEETPTETKDIWDFEYTAEVPEWTKQPFVQQEFLANQENMDAMYTWADSIDSLKFATAWIPSMNLIPEDGEEGYTNDLSKEYDSFGNPNMYFSYVLREDYLRTYAIGINRLLNPVFGNWVFAQHNIDGVPSKDNSIFTSLKDVFSEDWWNSNIKDNVDYTKLPVVADWNGTSFDGLKFADRNSEVLGTFYGIISETEDNQVTVEELDKGHRGGSILKITAPVSFYARGENDTLKKTGKLMVTLAPNTYEYSEMYRVVIIDAELVVD